MSWLVKAFSISTPQPGVYYSAIDPVEFYEWRYNQYIPKGAIFTQKLPRSETLTQGQVIVSSVIPKECLEKKKFGYELKENARVDVSLTAGQIASPQDIIGKFSSIKSDFDRSLEAFKKTCENHQYFISQTKVPHLYRILSAGEKASVENFGPVQDFVDRINLTKANLDNQANIKSGRAFELENYRKFDNAYTLFQSLGLPLDTPKMAFLIRMTGVQSEKQNDLYWKDVFTSVSADAEFNDARIKEFESLNWVKGSQSLLKI